MRGRSTSAKARLRSAGYKCNLCGRRVIDAATLERHQKTVHSVTTRAKESFKPKPVQTIKRKTINKDKDKEKVFMNLRKEKNVLEQSKPRRISRRHNDSQEMTVKTPDEEKMIGDEKGDLIENGGSKAEKEDLSRKNEKNLAKQIHFECPACQKLFSVYYNAHKHIQREHPDKPKITPIRIEPCCRCNCQIRSDEAHKCRQLVEDVRELAEYICSGCNQIFVSLKAFDMHVAGLHSDAVDSMFFPSKLEFVTWRLEMEQQTNAKYSLYGEYESKKIYRCNYARNDKMHNKFTAYFCPSSMVVQEFSKGIQVHFYHKHYDHNAEPYTLSSKYKKYSITSFLSSKTSREESSYASFPSSLKIDDKELLTRFKKLMDSILTNAADVDPSVLRQLIEKALEMTAIVTDATENAITSNLKTGKKMSDKEITEELEMKVDANKRRKSVDSCETLKPAKRIRNKSLFNQSPTKNSPKIINAFSLASSSNSEGFRSDNGDDNDTDTKSDNDKKSNQNKNAPESDVNVNKVTKMNTRLSSLSESLSFNDSYKDFIDKNFVVSKDLKSDKANKNKVKTKLGEFKQTSPRRAENKEDRSNIVVANRGTKPITSNKPKIDGSTKIDMETPKLNILSIETPIVKVTKMSSNKTDSTNADSSKMNLKNKGFSHLVDPLKINITKVTKSNSSVETRSNVSKVNLSANSPSALKDPLELNISKEKPRNVITPTQKNVVKDTRISSGFMDPIKVNTTKDVRFDPKNIVTKVYSGPGMPKDSTSPRNPNVIQRKVPDIKYEVREQENDCNILVLKF